MKKGKIKLKKTKFELNTEIPVLDDYERGYADYKTGRCNYVRIGNQVTCQYTITLDTRKPIKTLPFPDFNAPPGKIIEVKKRRKKK